MKNIFLLFFLLLLGSSQIHAQQLRIKAKADTIVSGFTPQPDSNFVSFAVFVYMPANDIWIDRYIKGNTLPYDIGEIICCQKKGAVIIYDHIIAKNAQGQLINLPQRKFAVK